MPGNGTGPGFACRRIFGRANDTVVLRRRDGSTFEAHSMVVGDTIKNLPDVRGYVVHQQGERIRVKLRLGAQRDLDDLRRRFLAKIARACPDLDETAVTLGVLDEEEPKTIAGKTRFIVRE